MSFRIETKQNDLCTAKTQNSLWHLRYNFMPPYKMLHVKEAFWATLFMTGDPFNLLYRAWPWNTNSYESK